MDESALTGSIVGLAGQYGRYGDRRVHALLESQGWQVSHGRVMRIWRREGLKVPSKQPKRSRLWLNEGSCIRLRPERSNPVWSWDFVFDRTDDGRSIKLMVVIDEYTHQCLAIHVARRIRARDAIDVFADLMETHGNPCSLVGNSLFPKSGNTPGGTPNSDQITEAASLESPDFGVFPCIFPANQGFAPRDEFATDCTLRQVLGAVSLLGFRSAFETRP